MDEIIKKLAKINDRLRTSRGNIVSVNTQNELVICHGLLSIEEKKEIVDLICKWNYDKDREKKKSLLKEKKELENKLKEILIEGG